MTPGAAIILRHAALFDTLARAASMTSAARMLGMSKSAVSKQVAETEHTLGVLLFARTTRRMQPTVSGAQLLAGARQLVRDARRLEAALVRPPRPTLLPDRHRMHCPPRPAWVTA